MRLNIEYLPINALTPYENNARKHQKIDVAAIVASIREFGFNDPICVWGERNVIVEGHGRLLAAKELGLDLVPVIHLDHLSDEQRRAYALAHNRTAELSEWDEVVRELELKSIDDIDMSLFGFDISAIPDASNESATADEDMELPEPPAEPKSKLGDIYQLGRHRLMCGDSTNPGDIDRLLAGAFMRMTVTSPPYGVGKDYEEKGIEPWKKTISGVINAIKGKTLIICWNIGDLFSTGTQFTEPTGAYSIQMMFDAGYGMLYNRIWRKPGANFAGNNPYYTVTTKPAQDYEYLYAFAEIDADRHIDDIKDYLFEQAKIANINDAVIKAEGGPAFMCGHWFSNHQWSFIDAKNYALIQHYCAKNGIHAFDRAYDDIKRDYLRNTIFSHNLSDEEFSAWGLYGIWEFNTVHERLGGHAAAFPTELPTRYIKMHSYEDDRVLDPFGGTGTTMIACEQLNRVCYMMELDPHYVDVIISRWENLTGQKAVLLNGR